jgi:hypothetical protein
MPQVVVPPQLRIRVANDWRYDRCVVQAFQRSGLAPYMTIESYIEHVLRDRAPKISQSGGGVFRPFRIDMYLRPRTRHQPRSFVVNPNSGKWLDLLRFEVMLEAHGDFDNEGLQLVFVRDNRTLDASCLALLSSAPAFAVAPFFGAQYARVPDLREQLRQQAAVPTTPSPPPLQQQQQPEVRDQTSVLMQLLRSAISRSLAAQARVVSNDGTELQLCNDMATAYATAYSEFGKPQLYVQAGIAASEQDAPKTRAQLAQFWNTQGVTDVAQFSSQLAHDVAYAVSKMPNTVSVDADANSDARASVAEVYDQHLINASVLGRLGRGLDRMLAGDSGTVCVRLTQDFTPVAVEHTAVREQSRALNKQLVCDMYGSPLMWYARSGDSAHAACKAGLYSDWTTLSDRTIQALSAARKQPQACFMEKANRPHRVRRRRGGVGCARGSFLTQAAQCVKNTASSVLASATHLICESAADNGVDSINTRAKSYHSLRSAADVLLESAAGVDGVKIGVSMQQQQQQQQVVDAEPLISYKAARFDSQVGASRVSSLIDGEIESTSASTPSFVAYKATASAAPAAVALQMDSLPPLVQRFGVAAPIKAELAAAAPLVPAVDSVNPLSASTINALYDSDEDYHANESGDDDDYKDDDDDEDEPPAYVRFDVGVAAAPIKAQVDAQPAAAAPQQQQQQPQFLADLIDHCKRTLSSAADKNNALVLVVPECERFNRVVDKIRGLPEPKRAALLDHYVCSNSVSSVVVDSIKTTGSGTLSSRSGAKQWELVNKRSNVVVKNKAVSSGAVSRFSELDLAAHGLQDVCSSAHVVCADATHCDV